MHGCRWVRESGGRRVGESGSQEIKNYNLHKRIGSVFGSIVSKSIAIELLYAIMPAPVIRSQSELADVKGRSDVAGETDRSDSADTDLFGKYKRKRCTLDAEESAHEQVPVRIKWSRKDETETMQALKDAQDTIKRLAKLTESQMSNRKRS